MKYLRLTVLLMFCFCMLCATKCGPADDSTLTEHSDVAFNFGKDYLVFYSIDSIFFERYLGDDSIVYAVAITDSLLNQMEYEYWWEALTPAISRADSLSSAFDTDPGIWRMRFYANRVLFDSLQIDLYRRQSTAIMGKVETQSYVKNVAAKLVTYQCFMVLCAVTTWN